MSYVVDIAIIFGLISGAMIGFRRGFFSQTINFVGFIVAVALAFLLKDWLAAIFCKHLPFLNFNDIIIFNVLFYEILAFIIILSIILSIFRIVFTITKVFERVLKYTVLLGIPSKILGAIVGVIQFYIIIVFVLIFLAQPSLGLSPVHESTFASTMMSSADNRFSPVGGVATAFREITDLEDVVTLDEDEMNLRVLDIMLDRGITRVSLIEDLVKRNRLPIENIESVLNKHR